MQEYLRYWGKAKPSGEAGGAPCHLLAYHSLDVAAVGFCLTDTASSKGSAISNTLGLSKSGLQSIFTFLLAIHDLGKFSQSFQALATPNLELLKGPDPTFSYDIPGGHAALGMLLWKRSPVFREKQIEVCGWPEPGRLQKFARRSMEAMLETTFGHHGQPVSTGSEGVEGNFLLDDEYAACEFAMEVARLIQPEWPVSLMGNETWHQSLKKVTWQLAGLAVLADWLGSDQSVFSYVTRPMSLTDYWHEFALPRARHQVERLGFNRPRHAMAFTGVKSFFGFAPTPLQSWAEGVDISESPQLFILEDVTGAGKTEAAVTLAHRLLSQGCAEGVYSGCPPWLPQTQCMPELRAITSSGTEKVKIPAWFWPMVPSDYTKFFRLPSFQGNPKIWIIAPRNAVPPPSATSGLRIPGKELYWQMLAWEPSTRC